MSEGIELIENCQVEWDRGRGVLYVHNKDTGGSVVRICGLPVPNAGARTLADYGNMIDVTLKFGNAVVSIP